MLRSTCVVVALCLATVACDSDVVRAPDDPDDSPPAEPEARVDDCVRAGAGVPIARLTDGDPYSLATDGSSLFYMSDGRIFSLPLAGGAAQPLISNGFYGRDVQYADGFVYWVHDDTVYRVASSGGEPEALVELASSAQWAVAGDAILSIGGLPGEPSPLFRSSLTTGETTEILPLDESNAIYKLRVVGDRVLVWSVHRLLSMSVVGGDEHVLVDAPMSGDDPPVAFDGNVFFGARDEADHFVARVSSDDPGEPERVATGYSVSMAVDDEALYVNLIPVPEQKSDETIGELMRVPLDGAPPQRLSATPARAWVGFEIRTAGLVVDASNVYFIDVCTDSKPNEYRVVAIAKRP